MRHGSWSFCVSAWLLCSSNDSLLPYIGNMIKCDRGYQEKCNISYLKGKSVFLLEVYWFYLSLLAYWLEIFHMKSHSNGTVAVVYKMRICIVVIDSLILAEIQTDWMSIRNGYQNTISGCFTPVLGHLVLYHPRKNTKEPVWSIPHIPQ